MCFRDIISCVFLIEPGNFFAIATGSCRSNVIRENTLEVDKLPGVLGARKEKDKKYRSKSFHLQLV